MMYGEVVGVGENITVFGGCIKTLRDGKLFLLFEWSYTIQ